VNTRNQPSLRRQIIDEYDEAHQALKGLWQNVIRVKKSKSGAMEWYTTLVIAMDRIQEIKHVLDDNLINDCDRLVVTAHMVLSAQDIIWEPLSSDPQAIAERVDEVLDHVEKLAALLDRGCHDR
jgi:hypothetical protein